MTTRVVWKGPGTADAATQNWGAAVRTYRESVDLYRHVLEIRARRQAVPSRPPVAEPTIEAPAALRPPLGRPFGLTGRESDVARLLVLGYTNSQIAEALVITHGTTANHVAHILAKLGVVNRSQAVARLLQHTAD